VICPNCGIENPETSHGCGSCGIIFIKWMIQRHRASRREARKPGLGFPRKFSRAALGAAVTAGSLAGIAAGWLLHPLVPARDARPASFSGSEAKARLAPLLQEIQDRGEPLGVSFGFSDIRPYFDEGFRSLTIPNLVAVAGEEAPERQDSDPMEYTSHKDRPFRCRIDGVWSYHPAPPPDDFGARECWLLSRVFRTRKQVVAVYWDYFWRKLQWAPEKGRWAVFTREQERRLFAAYIEAHLGDDARRRDEESSQTLLRRGGSDRQALKEAVLTAYRSSVRREGALLTLEGLAD